MPFMLFLRDIVIKLQDRNLSEISRRTNIPTPTLWRIANGLGENVSYITIERLSNYLQEGEE